MSGYNYGALATKFGTRATDSFYALDTNSDPSGGTTVAAPFTVNMPDGYAAIAEDPGLNTGIQVYRDQVLGGNNASYMNAVCVSGGVNVSYGGFAHRNDGTAAGTATEFYSTDSSENVIGVVEINQANGILIGNPSSATPNVRVVGSAGSGQVFDNLYNNPNLPTYSSVLGAGVQLATTPAGGAYTPVVPAFAVDAEQYYRVSLAGNLSANVVGAPAGLMALIIKFNTTADSIILYQENETSQVETFVSTIEFRVPTGNTQMTIGVQGYAGFPGTDTVQGGWSSLSIVQLN